MLAGRRRGRHAGIARLNGPGGRARNCWTPGWQHDRVRLRSVLDSEGQRSRVRVPVRGGRRARGRLRRGLERRDGVGRLLPGLREIPDLGPELVDLAQETHHVFVGLLARSALQRWRRRLQGHAQPVAERRPRQGQRADEPGDHREHDQRPGPHPGLTALSAQDRHRILPELLVERIEPRQLGRVLLRRHHRFRYRWHLPTAHAVAADGSTLAPALRSTAGPRAAMERAAPTCPVQTFRCGGSRMMRPRRRQLKPHKSTQTSQRRAAMPRVMSSARAGTARSAERQSAAP